MNEFHFDTIISTQELISAIARGADPKYVFFWGHRPAAEDTITKTCFSQWFEAPFIVDGDRYQTAEHFMMAEKARLFRDEETRQQVLVAATPAEAKKLGRGVRNFQDSLWLAERFGIVVNANMAKFSQNPLMAEFLLGTGDRVLVEASPVDSIWGIGLATDSPDASRPDRWPGLNLLGFALMQVRSALRNDAAVKDPQS